MPAMAARRFALLAAAVLALAPAGCGGDGDGAADEEGAEHSVTAWILENEPERVRATIANVAALTRATGIKVRVVGIGDDQLASRVERARATGALPDVMQLPLDSAHAYARAGILDTGAAEEVVRQLREETFSQTALSLVSREGGVVAVPSDGWGQLLIYRKDLFRAAGLDEPRTLPDVRRAARRLHRDGLAGIALATAPGIGFTAETFEHVALIAGCQLVDEVGKITLTSPRCREAFRLYVDLARNSSVPGSQDADSTRDTYFAGRAAMIFWSPFLLDAMAGLRDDAVPTCPQCKEDPAYLARNSGLVGALGNGRGRERAQYGSIATWGIVAGRAVEPAKRFVEYMLSDGYARWLALSPQGKYPVRPGDASDPERFARQWAGLRSGVERKAPLERFYSEASIESLGEGVRSFRRWGFEQGQAVLLGALRGPQPISKALGAAISGRISAAEAARRSQAAVEKLSAASPVQ
jgi:multiple sugar transport system substrate-binding protein